MEVVEEPVVEKVEEVVEEVAEKVEEESNDIMEVFIGGLAFEATEDAVKADFAECGEIADFRFPLNEWGQSKGIAFCVFNTKAAVEKALAFNETDYGGRTLRVRLCEPKGGKKGDKGKGKKGKDGKKGGKSFTPGEKPEGCKSVIVKNLSYNTTEDKLWELFGNCGDIVKVNLLKNRETGESRGMAFIDFSGESMVDEAIKKNNSDIDGRNCFVDFAGGKKEDGDKGKGKKGKDGKKGKGKKGKSFDSATTARNGAIQDFAGKAQNFSDSD